MQVDLIIEAFDQLTLEQKGEVLRELRARYRVVWRQPPLSPDQRRELEERLARHRDDPSSVYESELVHERLRQSLEAER